MPEGVTKYIEGGDKLRRYLADLISRVGPGGTLKVGFLSNAKYPDGKPVAMIAAIQEYGAPSRNIPPRPFFRNMVARRSSEWPAEIEAQIKSTNYNGRLTMNRMKEVIKGDLKLSIRDTNDPPLAPSTIKRKGFDKPLIHTSHMLNSVDGEYEER